MTTIRRIIAATGVIAGIYFIASMLFGALPFAHALINITAIDHWHPNWPNPDTVDAVAELSPHLAGALAALMLLAYIGLGYLDRELFPPVSSGVTLSATRPALMAGPALYPYTPSRDEFRDDLIEFLRDSGVSRDKATEVADDVMLTMPSWGGEIRDEALSRAGAGGLYTRILSREPHLDKTAQFLRDYGYRATRMRRVSSDHGGDDHPLNYNGLLVWHRTTASDAEEALIELLIATHQAHMASMDDNGDPTKRGYVEQYATTLRHVCTKLALRGFVPPELDAEVGRDGTASAEELERWAVAQVVATCSPMTRMPLPTVDRTVVGSDSGVADG